jgi:glycosyltransferase involved in cell wall biosynthesis
MIKGQKVLFLDTTLHKKDSSGITLSNLFGNWPKENLFMIGTLDKTALSFDEGYTNTYTLGRSEFNHRFLFRWLLRTINFLKKKSENFEYNNLDIQTNSSFVYINIKFKKIKSFLCRLFRLLGLDYYFFRCTLSEKLALWINSINPDFCYALLATRHSIIFVKEVTEKYKIPLIIHILDDFPTTIGRDTLFPNYWNRKINTELKSLIKISFKRLAISESMAKEYERRFGGEWQFFHNPVFLKYWMPFQKTIDQDIQLLLNKDPIKIGYFGRIGNANSDSIMLMIKAIDVLSQKHPTELHIFTVDSKFKIQSNMTFFHSYIVFSQLPEMFSKFDFLLLPISFSKSDLKFAKFSIPTKLSEYLISGVPIIYLGPPKIAVADFIDKYRCGYPIMSEEINSIVNLMEMIFSNRKKQREMSEAGKVISQKHFDADNVLTNFQSLFMLEMS